MTNYPLAWPAGWPRKTDSQRADARFGRQDKRTVNYTNGTSLSWSTKKALTVSDGVNRVLDVLARLGARPGSTVISTNVAVRLDGLPRSGQREPADPGAAVYWQDRAGAPRVMAIDQYRSVADNLAAIAATLEAMRAIERHGGAQILERAFTGFTALPSPGAARGWREIIGVPAGEQDLDAVRAAFRRRAQAAHPDRGGSHDGMAELTAAMRQAEEELA
ncbi:J domain-containing protein [Cupriavidus taiwanensis]|uniref:J domain-containing protein n=1 Tax=Cupriavidus taiwanensis TaxID=164546 RepID=UPI00157248CE|nr:J domain-containing protein [Cupriavidus taiwanensis]NSX14045.1 J domain-containing protein [Cupriavidus taiwanensis]